MPRLTRFVGGLRALFRRTTIEQELDDELRAYLDAAVEQKMSQGLTREAAVRAARVESGSLAAVKDHTRDAGWESVVESVWQDVRYALRSFRRSPGFTAAAIVTLGLGIGGTTAVFSVVDGLFFRAPEGVADAAVVRKVFIRRDSGNLRTPEGGPGSWVDYLTMREGVPLFAAVGAELGRLVDLGLGDHAEQVRGSTVSDDYFRALGIQPAAGRLFAPEDDSGDDSSPVAVISHAMWQRRFHGAADAPGTTLAVNGRQTTIVGVTPKGFSGIGAEPVELWLPASTLTPGLRAATAIAFSYVARLADGTTDLQAAAQAAAALRRAAESEPQLDPMPEVLTTSLALAAAPAGTTEGRLSLWLAVVAGLVLVIACANVANLLVARSVTRRREIALRLSIGAATRRVVRQHITESLVLAVLGGGAGIAVAHLAMTLMQQFPLPPAAGRLDGRLLAFAAAVSLLTGLIFGLAPALRAIRMQPIIALKNPRATAGVSGNVTRRTLVTIQVSLSILLLVGAGLVVQSLRQVNSIAPGVDLERLLVVSANFRSAGYSVSERESFFDAALARLSVLPAVERAAMIHYVPLSGSGSSVNLNVPGREIRPVEGPYINLAGPGYFETAGTHLLRGRTFGAGDSREPEAIVNEAMARLIADDGDVVGSCVAIGSQVDAGGCTTIIGIVETQRHRYLENREVPVVFLPRMTAPGGLVFGEPSILVRVHGDPVEQVAAVRGALQGLRPDLPYLNVRPVSENIRRQVLPFRLGATLFTIFGALAMALVGVGLYGVLGYFVSERTAEIGIRRSLGAPAHTVVVLVVRQALVPVALGLVIGLTVAFGGTRYLETLLFGIEPRDLLSFLSAASLLVCAAIIAALVPAWRAARVDPMVALRCE